MVLLEKCYETVGQCMAPTYGKFLLQGAKNGRADNSSGRATQQLNPYKTITVGNLLKFQHKISI
jgi:hypothetical protein